MPGGDALEVENLVPPDAVRRLCWAPPPDLDAAGVAGALAAAGARPWQVELTTDPLVTALTPAPAPAAPGRGSPSAGD